MLPFIEAIIFIVVLYSYVKYINRRGSSKSTSYFLLFPLICVALDFIVRALTIVLPVPHLIIQVTSFLLAPALLSGIIFIKKDYKDWSTEK